MREDTTDRRWSRDAQEPEVWETEYDAEGEKPRSRRRRSKDGEDWSDPSYWRDRDQEEWDAEADRRREQHVLEMIEAGLARKKREDRVVELYDRYCRSGNEILLGELLQQIQAMTRGSVTKTLRDHYFYKGNEESREVSSEISMNLMVLLRQDYEKGVCRDNILNMIRAYYKNRTLDAIRIKYRRNGYVYRAPGAEAGDESRRRWVAGKHAVTEESWDEWNTDEEGKPMERVGQLDPVHDEHNQLLEEKRALSAALQRLYLEALLNYGKEPYKAVALCYCRILYHVERMLDPAEIQRAGDRLAAQDDRKRTGGYEKMVEAFRTVQNTTTATAPKWAIARMGERSLLELALDAQASLQRNMDPGLCWSERFLQKLEEDSGIDGKKWKDVVLTQAFTYKQINKLAESIHVAVFHAAQRRMLLECPELVDEAVRLGFSFWMEGKAFQKGETK